MIGKRIKLVRFRGIPFTVTYVWVIVFLLVTSALSQPHIIDDYVNLISTVTFIPLTGPNFSSQLTATLFAAVLVLSLYGTVILHELGHTYAALKHGVSVNSITLWVLGGAAEINSQPENPRIELEIAIAGPIVSFIIFTTFFVAGYASTALSLPAVTAYLFITSFLNLFMVIVNLLPAFPLDGGRILRAGFAAKYGYVEGTRKATNTAKAFAAFTGILSVFTFYLFGLLLAVFIYFAATGEQKRVKSGNSYANALEVDDSQKPPSEPPTETSTDIELENTLVTNQTFVFETTLPSYTLSTVTRTIEQHDGNVDEIVTQDTDYVIVPVDKIEMYRTIAKNNDLEIIPANEFDQVMNHLTTQNTPHV